MKIEHEIRDPIHGFIHLSGDEMRIVDSAPFQRLRHIRQLALTSLVYPGAVHTRFEHSLGVMELAGRIFDVVTREENLRHLTSPMRNQIAEGLEKEKREDWRRHLRFAALCHDLGHLPFSHAGESLLPDGWTTHESISAALITDKAGLGGLWGKINPSPPNAEVIAKLAVEPDEEIWRPLGRAAPKLANWEGILSQIIVGDAFGADRMDYLLRDAHYAGVPNGVFDHLQLIEALRILPDPHKDKKDAPLALGLVRGGLHSAEALMMARYCMYQQVYNHRTRKIYDFHLRQFLREWLPGGMLPVSIKKHLQLKDVDVWAGIWKAARSPNARGHESAARILGRGHLKIAYHHRPRGKDFEEIVTAAKGQFPSEFKREQIVALSRGRKHKASSFPVLDKDGRILGSESVSDFPGESMLPSYGYVFADGKILKKAKEWFKDNTENSPKET